MVTHILENPSLSRIQEEGDAFAIMPLSSRWRGCEKNARFFIFDWRYPQATAALPLPARPFFPRNNPAIPKIKSGHTTSESATATKAICSSLWSGCYWNLRVVPFQYPQRKLHAMQFRPLPGGGCSLREWLNFSVAEWKESATGSCSWWLRSIVGVDEAY